jgi:hypothetical protein
VGFSRPWGLPFAERTCPAAAIGFPVVIMLLIPLRVLVVPRLSFTPEELAILDRPAASPFVSACLFYYSRLIIFPPADYGIGGGNIVVGSYIYSYVRVLEHISARTLSFVFISMICSKE